LIPYDINMSIIIFDELTGSPTVLATNRIKRDDQTGVISGVNKPRTEQAGVCYFCKGNEHLTTQTLYQDTDDWNVRVFTNKYPIVDNHEIIVHSPSHEKDLTDLPDEQVVRYIRALLSRINHYTTQGLEVMVFNNRGGKAGASILHPHSQLIAMAGFPGLIETEKHEALKYYDEHNSCYWCDTWKSELATKDRVIHESKHFVLIAPKASRWSYEMMLVPKSHKPNIEYIDEVEINDFAKMLKASLYAYDKFFNKPDRNFWIHTQRYDPFHWHIGYIPHIKVFGGLELGAGIWVSDRATPEEAAKQLGEKVKEFYDNSVSSISDGVGSSTTN
jgi:UDPglucose--hexose-1-phosphate uridylyltransferase